jgi:hypothetical protein
MFGGFKAHLCLSCVNDFGTSIKLATDKETKEHYQHFIVDLFRLNAGLNVADFDEKFYLSYYPEVAEAVKSSILRSGMFKSGYEHYILYGMYEGRAPNEGVLVRDRVRVASEFFHGKAELFIRQQITRDESYIPASKVTLK